jgi:hypothetical protein
VPEGEPRLDFRDMTEADLADGLRLSRASGWNQTPEDWRLPLGPVSSAAVLDGRIGPRAARSATAMPLAWIA